MSSVIWACCDRTRVASSDRRSSVAEHRRCSNPTVIWYEHHAPTTMRPSTTKSSHNMRGYDTEFETAAKSNRKNSRRGVAGSWWGRLSRPSLWGQVLARVFSYLVGPRTECGTGDEAKRRSGGEISRRRRFFRCCRELVLGEIIAANLAVNTRHRPLLLRVSFQTG